jgi:hypothetical protein
MPDNNSIIPLDNSEQEGLIRRTDDERERDRVLIARMYVRGKSKHEMTAAIRQNYPDRNITPKMIHLDLQEIRRAWLQSTLIDFNAAKAKELARLDEAEREAWDAWEKSKSKHVRIEYETSDYQVPFSADKIADVSSNKKRKIIEATVGDIKYLEMVERMIKMRCDILGLFEAKRLQVDWRVEALQSGMDEAAIDAVKEKTVQTLLEAITTAARESGAIKETDIIEGVLEDSDGEEHN